MYRHNQATCSEGNPLRNLPIEISCQMKLKGNGQSVFISNCFTGWRSVLTKMNKQKGHGFNRQCPLIILYIFSAIKIVKILLILPCNEHLSVLLHKSIIGISIIINGNHNAYMCHSVSIKLIQVSKLALLFQNECFHKQKNILIIRIMFQMKPLNIV